jgi:CBS-domain-containing membrane protein
MISFIKRLTAAIQQTPNHHRKVVLDDTSFSLFENEISECEISLQVSKKHLAKVISGKIAAKRKLDNQLENILNKKEAIAIKKQQRDIATATQLSKELLTLEQWSEENQKAFKQLERHEQDILQVLKNTAQTLGHYRYELKVAKAASQRNHSTATSPTISATSIASMQQSLNRIKQRC